MSNPYLLFNQYKRYIPYTLLIFVLLLSSCASKKDILYLQDIDKLANQTEEMYNNLVIRPNDLLVINVSAADMEVAMPFNLLAPARNLQQANSSLNREQQGYIVNNDGTIEFPILGTLKVGGLTRQELIQKLKEEISKHIINPIINVRIVNYKVTVLGEVTRPGTYTIGDERVTLLEAIGMAGDLSIYGRRDNIIVVRENEGVKEYKIIDITKTDFLQSDYYYLQQNDVIYVQPNGPQVQASAYNRNITAYVSISSLIISVIVLIDRF